MAPAVKSGANLYKFFVWQNDMVKKEFYFESAGEMLLSE
jgi:hypothetical protein